MAYSPKRMFLALDAAREARAYDELPMLRTDIDMQVHLSRNDRPQPFFLICGHDTLLTQLAGEATLELKYSPVLYHTLEPGDIVYVPAGTPTRVVPTTPSVQLRYKSSTPGLEGVAWFCADCGTEVHRDEFDCAEELPQDAYWRACAEFNSKAELRQCPACGAAHPPLDLSGVRWPEVAEMIRTTR